MRAMGVSLAEKVRGWEHQGSGHGNKKVRKGYLVGE